MSNLHAIGDEVLFYHGVTNAEIHGTVVAYHDPDTVVIADAEDGEDVLWLIPETDVRPGDDPDRPEYVAEAGRWL